MESWKSASLIDRGLLLLLVTGVVGFVCFFWKLDEVFPAASIDLRLNKQQIEQRARQILVDVGNSDAGLISATTFASQDYQEIFLEHEYSVREANNLMRREIPVWLWSTRFCKALAMEEFMIWLTTDGRLNSYGHTIEKERPLPSVSHGDAMRLAIKFARDHAGISLPVQDFVGEETGEQRPRPASFENSKSVNDQVQHSAPNLIVDGTIKQSRRLDHYFTWEDQSRDYKGGRMRTFVYVSGNIITEFSHALHVPESFERRYENIRSYNELLSSIAQVPFACLMAAMCFVTVWALSTHQIRWKLVLVFGLLAFLGDSLSTLNNWPAIVKAYKSNVQFNTYVGETAFAALVQAILSGAGAMMLIAGTEFLYRRAYPRKLLIDSYLQPATLNSKQVFQGLFGGVAMFGVQLGWITVYYLTGRACGVWSPLQMREVAVLSSVVPAYSSFCMAIEASVFEELLCRVVCLILVQKVTKNFWIANIVQAVSWAFMHSNYPQEPAYVRGVELSVVGLTFGMLVRRFGIIPSVVSHFTYNCLLGVLPLLSPATPALMLTGLVSLSPAFIWLTLSVLRIRSAGVADDTALLNQSDIRQVEKSNDSDSDLDYQVSKLSGKSIKTMLAAGVLALLLLLLPIRQIGQDARLSVNKEQAEAVAKQYLHSRGVTDAGWQINSYTVGNLDSEEIQYGFEKTGLNEVTRIMSVARYPLIWYVRFFKPGSLVYYQVMVSPAGRPIGLDVEKPEEAEGQTISEAQARESVERFLESDRPEFKSLKLGSSSKTQREHRVDHTFIYEAPDFRMGDARLRVIVSTVGGEVDRPSVNWDVPESWSFERRKKTLKDQLATYGLWGTIVVACVMFFVWLMGVLRSQAVHWRPGVVAISLYAITAIVQFANELPGVLIDYNTSVPLASFWISAAMDKAREALQYGAMVAFLGVVSFAALRLIQPGQSLTAFFRKCCLPSGREEEEYAAAVWSDAAIFGYSATALMTGIDRLAESAQCYLSPSAPIADFSTVIEASAVFSPAIDFTVQSLALTLVSVMCVPVVVGLFARFCKKSHYFVVLSVCGSLMLYAGTRYWQSYVIDVIGCAGTVLMFYFLIRYVAKNNVLAYAVFAFVSLMTAKILGLCRFGFVPYTFDVLAAILITMLPLMVAIFRRVSVKPR